MARTLVALHGNPGSRAKVKTGCGTCRIRKVKCDEDKPFCQRCVGTGRTCDGYASPFRIVTSKSAPKAHAGGTKAGTKAGVNLQAVLPAATEITAEDIDLLNRHFSIKTLFDVKMDCSEEARQILQASLTDLPIRHAVASLRALREHLETSGDVPAADVVQQPPRYSYGLQQYCMALGGLASNLTSATSSGLKSALLCCQIFISIEQVRANYIVMVQHIIRGLGIMHEYRARPYLIAETTLAPAHHGQLPWLDAFIIKLFVAPCKFAEQPATPDASGTASPASVTASTEPLTPPPQQPSASRTHRTIAPDMRTELTRIAFSTIEFLAKVSQMESVETGLELLSEKKSLLNSLELWLIDVELARTETGLSDLVPVAVLFLHMFYLILKIVLLGSLDSSPDLSATLQTENDKLQSVAKIVGERVRHYKMPIRN